MIGAMFLERTTLDCEIRGGLKCRKLWATNLAWTLWPVYANSHSGKDVSKIKRKAHRTNFGEFAARSSLFVIRQCKKHPDKMHVYQKRINYMLSAFLLNTSTSGCQIVVESSKSIVDMI